MRIRPHLHRAPSTASLSRSVDRKSDAYAKPRMMNFSGVVVGLTGVALLGSATLIGSGAGTTAAGTTVPAAVNLSALYPLAPLAPKPRVAASKPAPHRMRLSPVPPASRRPRAMAAETLAMPSGLQPHTATPRRAVFTPPPTSPPTTAPPAPPPTTVPAPHPTPNPSSSLAPSQAFDDTCFVASVNVSACDSAALADIDQARADEGIGPMELPGNFYSLSTEGQLIAVANAERAGRGLPAMSENSTLNALAQKAAAAGTDPTGPSGYSWGSIYALGDPTALAADYSWMYDDGPASPNVDCPKAGSPGCWGHRDNILSSWGGEAGAGVSSVDGRVSLTILFVENY